MYLPVRSESGVVVNSILVWPEFLFPQGVASEMESPCEYSMIGKGLGWPSADHLPPFS